MPESKSQARWRKEHTTGIRIRLNHNTDSDILEWLDKQSSRQGAIRAVLKEHIRQEQQQAPTPSDDE